MKPIEVADALRSRAPRIAFGFLAILGLAVYLWAALTAPVVLWSDSTIDMDWAREGIGITKKVPPPPPGEPLVHPPKVGYLVFLSATMHVVPPLGEARSVVLVQSLLLWLSIAATSWLAARRLGDRQGLVVLFVLLADLRIRDAASAVMSEAISAALCLPLTALCIWKPRSLPGFALAALGTAALFAIRPDVGAILFLLAITPLLWGRNWRPLVVYVSSFFLLSVCIWTMTRPVAGPDPLRGLGHPILEGSATYYWHASLGDWPRAPTQQEMERRELARAAENWKRTLARSGPDTRRELAWRTIHGVLGTEFYDARWSTLYRFADDASRWLTPFLILAMVATLALPCGAPASGPSIVGGLLLLCLVGHNLLFGSNPRYLLPFLSFLLLLPVVKLSGLAAVPASRRAAAGLLFALLVLAASGSRHVLDWQWGMVEAPGVTIRQPIGRGALPASGPATLHVRIAPPFLPTGARIEIVGSGQEILYDSTRAADLSKPTIAVSLPESLMAENRQRPVFIEVRSSGSFDAQHFFLFPVIPPPWSAAAQRIGSDELSPSTGLRRGALDWWAHAGADSTEGVPR